MHCTASERAQASGFVVFFLIVGLVVLWGLLNAGMSDIFTASLNSTSNATAESQINQRQAIWSNLPFMLLIFAGVFLIARSTVQSRQ